MVNLIAGEQVVPELVQHDFTAANIVAELSKVIPEGAARNRMLEGLTQVKARLRAPGNATEDPPSHPADRAAAIILAIGKRDRQIAHQTIENAGC